MSDVKTDAAADFLTSAATMFELCGVDDARVTMAYHDLGRLMRVEWHDDGKVLSVERIVDGLAMSRRRDP